MNGHDTAVTGDGDRDWFDANVAENRRRMTLLRVAPMSRAWARSGRRWGEDRVADLRAIRNILRGFAVSAGAPTNCRVELAGVGNRGAALAGFEDAPDSFERPYILVDKTIYEKCHPDMVLDVYCGVTAHEVGHIRKTRDGYRRLASCRSDRFRVYENLLEDERIETLEIRDSPGIAPYIQVAKDALLERGEFGKALANWKALPDLDKIRLMFLAFIRLPHKIDEEMKAWEVINGECVFATLRCTLPSAPRTEADVERMALELERLRERLESLYPGAPEASAKDRNTGREAAARLENQLAADAEDRAANPTAESSGTKFADRLRVEAARLTAAGWEGAADRLIDQALRAEALKDAGWPKDRLGRRFSEAELERICDRLSLVCGPLSRKEAGTVKRQDRDRSTDGEVWHWGSDRQTVIMYPRPEDSDHQRYAEAQQHVRAQVAAMRAVFSLSLGQRVRYQRERTSGRLDRRRIALGPVTNRIFRLPRVEPDRGLAICLLLDESGSMARGEPVRAEATLQGAVLVVEALKAVPGIELEVYSHTSSGPSNRDCLVRCLYGRKNPVPTVIGSYRPRQMNYDHQAIRTVAQLFEQNTTCAHRIMLVLSDGDPAGEDYESEAAIRATRQAVEAVRRRGIRVVNIAIDDYQSAAIFGKQNVVKFTELDRLASDMQKLVTQIVRRATEGG
jgi:hypothetical protein